MSSSTSSSSSSQRRRRRGGQHHRPSEGYPSSSSGSRGQGSSPGSSHSGGPRNGGKSAAPPKKKGLIAKIVGFFKGESAAPATRPGTSRPPGGRDSQGTPSNRSPQPVERRTRHAGGGQSGTSSQSQSQGGPRRSEGSPRGERPARRGPDLREVTTSRLYVGNLSYDATEEDLTELFRGVGTVESAEVVTQSRTQRSKGFAFVEMSAVDQARRAAEQLHDTEFMGRKLVVTGAKPATAQDQQGA